MFIRAFRQSATALAALVLGAVLLTLVAPPMYQAHAASASNQFICQKVGYAAGALTTLTQTSTTVSCPGVALGDLCDGVSSSVDPGAGIVLSCNVSAAGTVRIQVFNSTAGTLTPPSANYTVLMAPKYISP
jgi:hypothetical protein